MVGPRRVRGRAAASGAPALRAGLSAPAAHPWHDLQRRYGNHAVGSLVGPSGVLQRAVGWPGAAGWNKGGPRTIDAKHQMLRVALAGLQAGNKAPSPNPAKTTEQAADDPKTPGARAIVWIHPALDPARPVQVVTHLHGLTNRSADPFAGWRENIADPQTDESDAAKKAALATAVKEWRKHRTGKRPTLEDMPNPLANQVRDVHRDRIGEQIEAVGDPQVMAVLPQGTGVSRTAMFGAGFDPDALVSEILTRLAAEPDVTAKVKKYKVPASYTIVLSAHSAGGAAATEALAAKRTRHLGGLILFDALWAEQSTQDPKVWVSGQRTRVLDWVRERCRELVRALRTATTRADEDQALAALPGVHAYWTGGVYTHSYRGLEAAMHKIVDDVVPAAHRAAAKAKFKVSHAATSHDRMIGQVGASGSSVAPLEEALGQRGTFVARLTESDRSLARRTPRTSVQRDDPKAKPATAKVELTWDGELKNAAQLQPVLDAHPADLEADVVEGKKVLTTADTTATVEVAATPKAHTFKVVPKATDPDDYFLPGKTAVEVDPAATRQASVTLPYNRSNARFTERTWEATGISVTKANDIYAATLFGRKVIGGLNKAVEAKVDAANTWFTTNVSAAEQVAAQTSIVSLAGRVKRTQSRGTFSNHSTGVAVDINPSESSLQNWHVKQDDATHATAMRLFNLIVSQRSLVDEIVNVLAGLVVPGADLAPFKDFDVWKERDRDRLLEASERFNTFFPQILVLLVKDADPSRTPAPTVDNVMALTSKELTALAKLATKAKKADVAAALTDVATVWYQVRAWVGGYVFAKKGAKGDVQGMLRSEFEAKQAKEKAWTSTGELKGMISIHPAIVKALTESGWSWMVDYRHDDEKDFMHFEDRTAERSLKTP